MIRKLINLNASESTKARYKKKLKILTLKVNSDIPILNVDYNRGNKGVQ
jgi:hypothetical protein